MSEPHICHFAEINKNLISDKIDRLHSHNSFLCGRQDWSCVHAFSVCCSGQTQLGMIQTVGSRQVKIKGKHKLKHRVAEYGCTLRTRTLIVFANLNDYITTSTEHNTLIHIAVMSHFSQVTVWSHWTRTTQPEPCLL